MDLKETQNNYIDTQKDLTETQKDLKETHRYHKEKQNNYKDTKGPQRHTKQLHWKWGIHDGSVSQRFHETKLLDGLTWHLVKTFMVFMAITSKIIDLR